MCIGFAIRVGFDPLHAYAWNEFFLPALWCAKALGKKVVIESTLTGKGPYHLKRTLRGRLLVAALRPVDAFVGVSRSIVESFVRTGFSSKDKLFWLPRSIETAHFCPATPEQQRCLCGGGNGVSNPIWRCDGAGSVGRTACLERSLA